MSDTARIHDILSMYERLNVEGKSATVEELCRDCPELLEQVKRGIDLRAMRKRLPISIAVALSLLLAGVGVSWFWLRSREVLTLKGHTGSVNCVAFSPDGKRLASAGGGRDARDRLFGELKVWDVQISR